MRRLKAQLMNMFSMKSGFPNDSLILPDSATFTGIGPEAKSNPVTLRIKYGIGPGISGIYPNPAAESKAG